MTTASFERATPIVLVAQKILQRAKQKCTEPAFLLICATQRIFFKEMGKKTLDEILRFGRSVTPKSQKGVKGWPIRFTEIGKRFSSCFRWIGLSSAQDQSPVRRLKRRSALLQCSRYRFHVLDRLSLTEYQHIECQWSSENPIYEGREIVELDLRWAQTRQKLANSSRIHEG